jgi:flagellar basal body-associated protein FliL
MKYSNNANKNKNSEKKTKKSIFQIILISAISILIVFFILYSIWFPSSQILGEQFTKTRMIQ